MSAQEQHQVDEAVDGVSYNFDEYPTILRMFQSRAKVRLIRGPAGSSKTSGCIAMMLVFAMMQKPFRGVRKSRFLAARSSYAQLAKSTIISFRNVLGSVATFTDGKPPRGHASFPLQDGTTVEIDISFLALDGDNVESDIRGLEYSVALIDEYSTAVDEEIVTLLITRAGRYPSKMEGGCTSGGVVLGATNGPLKNHWSFAWHQGDRKEVFDEMERLTGQPYVEMFAQPPALLRPARPGDPWAPNPKAENVKNLPGGYGFYMQMLSLSEAHISAFIEGEFADLKQGKVVFPGFGKIHILPRASFDAAWSRRPILLSADWGRTPVVLLAAERSDGGLVIFEELVGEDVSVETFFDDVVLPMLNGPLRGCPIAGATGDPSGVDISSATEVSPFSILHARGIPIELPAGMRVDRIAPRLEAARQRIARLGASGIPAVQVTSNCVNLIDALMNTYVYAPVRGASTGNVSELPVKHHVRWCSDLADAFCYLCLFRANELATADRDPYPTERRPSLPLFGG